MSTKSSSGLTHKQKARLQQIIGLANQTTNKNDTSIYTAVNSLISGYGQSGSSSSTPTVNIQDTKAITYMSNGTYSVAPDNGYDAIQEVNVTVNVPEVEVPEYFDFTGTNAEKVAQYSETWTLADTSFVIGSSASTSATSIKAAVSNRFTNTNGSPTLAFGDKDIIVVQKCLVTPTHSDEASGKTQQVGYSYVYVTIFSKRKTSDTSNKTTRQAYSMTSYINSYLNTSGVLTRAVGNYGFYMTPTAPSVASATAASTYVRCNSPTLYYRASSTYESTANIVLATECTYKWLLEVYTVDSMSSISSTMNNIMDDMLLNGLDIPTFTNLEDEL